MRVPRKRVRLQRLIDDRVQLYSSLVSARRVRRRELDVEMVGAPVRTQESEAPEGLSIGRQERHRGAEALHLGVQVGPGLAERPLVQAGDLKSRQSPATSAATTRPGIVVDVQLCQLAATGMERHGLARRWHDMKENPLPLAQPRNDLREGHFRDGRPASAEVRLEERLVFLDEEAVLPALRARREELHLNAIEVSADRLGRLSRSRNVHFARRLRKQRLHRTEELFLGNGSELHDDLLEDGLNLPAKHRVVAPEHAHEIPGARLRRIGRPGLLQGRPFQLAHFPSLEQERSKRAVDRLREVQAQSLQHRRHVSAVGSAQIAEQLRDPENPAPLGDARPIELEALRELQVAVVAAQQPQGPSQHHAGAGGILRDGLEVAGQRMHRVLQGLLVPLEDRVAVLAPRQPGFSVLGTEGRSLPEALKGFPGLPQPSIELGLQAEKLGLLLLIEVLQVGVVYHVQAPVHLLRIVHADDNLLAKLVEGVFDVHCGYALELGQVLQAHVLHVLMPRDARLLDDRPRRVVQKGDLGRFAPLKRLRNGLEDLVSPEEERVPPVHRLPVVWQPISPRGEDVLEIGIRLLAGMVPNFQHDLTRLAQLDELVEEVQDVLMLHGGHQGRREDAPLV
mmetsp:Transcript_1837/g.8061  ORF Transcript_1837/g.8061 Transcript_1837/m.8061 type:complete len:623 (+) Transcript_1837:961-2829(+)